MAQKGGKPRPRLGGPLSGRGPGPRQRRFGFGYQATHDLGHRQDFLDAARGLSGSEKSPPSARPAPPRYAPARVHTPAAIAGASAIKGMARSGPIGIALVIGSAEFECRGITATSSGAFIASRRIPTPACRNFVMALLRRNRQ